MPELFPRFANPFFFCGGRKCQWAFLKVCEILANPFFFCGGRKCQWAFLKVCEILNAKFRYRELQEVSAYFC